LPHAAVQEAAIVGFAHERWGEAPHAFVVLKQGARADERELCEFAHANLAHFKAPHSVTFVKELPKTATGKIQKYILRAIHFSPLVRLVGSLSSFVSGLNVELF
jgi:fatty-acyl-CoA synthase